VECFISVAMKHFNILGQIFLFELQFLNTVKITTLHSYLPCRQNWKFKWFAEN